MKTESISYNFLYARKFCGRPASSGVIPSQQSLCSTSIELAELVHIRSV